MTSAPPPTRSPTRAAAASARPLDPARLAWLERAAVALLLLAALVPRARGLTGPFDRELEGFQGACFAGFAINYERLGIGRFGGYPAFNLLLPQDPEATPYLYPNHPPLVPLLAWASVGLFGPEGWSEAWRAGVAPEGIEGPLRLPFFLLHLAGLAALWWAVRQGGSARLALLALAVAAFLPLSVVYAYLVNYENVYLPLLLVACGLHVRWLRGGRARDLGLCAAALLGAAAVTYAPVFFVPPLLLQAWVRSGWRRAALETAVLAPAALLPPLAHGAWVRASLPPEYSQPALERARALLGPLWDGSKPLPEWTSRQWTRLEHFFSEPLLWVACAGLVVVLARALRRARRPRAEAPDAPPEVSLALPLLLGGLAVLLGFYTHTFDGDGATNGQTLFLLNLVPAAAVLAAHALDALAPALFRLRGGLAPLVVVTLSVGAPALLRAGEIQRAWRAPGPRDDPALAGGPRQALPTTYGREIAELLPADAIGLVPRSMSFTPAVSFYAWRQLVPVSRELWGQALARIENQLHLGGRPRFMLMPRAPSPEIRAEIESVRADLARRFGQPLSTSEHWELWPSFD